MAFYVKVQLKRWPKVRPVATITSITHANALIALTAALFFSAFSCSQELDAEPADGSAPTSSDSKTTNDTQSTEKQTADPTTPRKFNYTLGLALVGSPNYPGANDLKYKARPFFAFQYGRFSISDSRASAVTGFGVGTSVALVDRSSWKASIGLRVDNGRKSADSPYLLGLPDIQRTLRGRVSATWLPTQNWSLSSSAQTDLLGRKGGSTLSFGVSRAVPIDDRQRMSFSAGTTLGDATYMNSYFGIDGQTALMSGRPAFVPGAGIRDIGIGASHNFHIRQRWFLMSTAGVSRLLGNAADSPVTRSKNQFGASISVAYQCCQ
jgi:MipA family protein